MKSIFTLFAFILCSLQITFACLPDADFNSNYSFGQYYLYNHSVDADSVRWNFGDGETDTTSSNFTHRYENAGFYTIQLIAYNSCGSDTINKNIFTSSAFYPCESQSKTEELTINYRPDIYYADSVVWTFPNGNTFIGLNPPPQTYDSAGIITYIVKLFNFANTANNLPSTHYISHEVEQGPRINILDFDYSVVNSNVDVEFTPSNIFGTNYKWFFGDGHQSEEVSPTHTYSSEGDYSVKLIAKHYGCDIDTVIKNISIYCNSLPEANFQTIQLDECDRTFQFNSFAYNADSIYYSFGDGTGYYADDVSHYYYSSGQYEVCQIAYNGCGADTICQTIDIGPTTSNPIFYPNQNDFSEPIFEFINLSDTATGYFWDFGDGTTSTETNPTHTYSEVGFYDVCLTSYAPCDTNTFCQPVFIDCITPEPKFTYLQPLSNFWGINFSTEITGVDSIVWVINDSISYTGSNPSHTFPTHGTYEVCQTVYACFNSKTTCQNVEVACSGPMADFIYELDPDTNFLFHFTDQSINGSTSFWDFGEDYDSSNLWSPSIFFDSEPSHDVIHIVSNGCSSDTMIQTISACSPSNIIYINKSATGSNNGRDWENAFTNLEDAFDYNYRCREVEEVWIAEGIYHPHETDQTENFTIYDRNLKIYGGFPNNGNPTFQDRNTTLFKTIISGNIGDSSNPHDNSFNLFNSQYSSNLTFDGLTFEWCQGTSAALYFDFYSGGPIPEFDNHLIINDCIFNKNRGLNNAALYARGFSKIEITNSKFIDNVGTAHLEISFADSIKISNCEFTNGDFYGSLNSTFNITIKVRGVSRFIDLSNSKFNNRNGVSASQRVVLELESVHTKAKITNCLFYDLESFYNGFFYLNNQNHIIENSVFYNNKNYYPLFYRTTENTLFKNNIFYQNYRDNYPTAYPRGTFENNLFDIDSCAQIGPVVTCNNGNIFGANPGFIDEANNDFRLKACSPAINAGTNTISTVTDFEGNPRPYQGIVDIGAYEWNGVNDDLNMLDPATVSEEIVQYADFSYTDENYWTHYYDCDSSEILLSIYYKGNTIPELNNGIEVAVKIQNKYGSNDGQDISSANFHNADNFFAMNRSWYVNVINQPLKPVGVRFYFHNLKDFNDVANMYFSRTGRDDIQSIADMVFYKLSNTDNAYDLSSPSADASLITFSNEADLNHFTIGQHNGIYYAEFEVSSFSAGSAGAMSSSGLLPVELLDFTAQNKENKYAQLDWQTASETNNSGFSIERSKNAIDFENIGWISGNGTTNQTSEYNFNDYETIDGKTYFYRIVQTDFDGELSYSNIESVRFEKNLEINIYPNPTSNFFKINSNQNQEYLVQIFSFDGQLISQSVSVDQRPIDVSQIPNGQYLIKISNSEISYQKTIQIIH